MKRYSIYFLCIYVLFIIGHAKSGDLFLKPDIVEQYGVLPFEAPESIIVSNTGDRLVIEAFLENNPLSLDFSKKEWIILEPFILRRKDCREPTFVSCGMVKSGIPLPKFYFHDSVKQELFIPTLPPYFFSEERVTCQNTFLTNFVYENIRYLLSFIIKNDSLLVTVIDDLNPENRIRVRYTHNRCSKSDLK